MKHLEAMHGSFMGIYFADIRETVNKNGEHQQIRWGTATRDSGEGYWSQHARNKRRNKNQNERNSTTQTSPDAIEIIFLEHTHQKDLPLPQSATIYEITVQHEQPQRREELVVA